MELYLDRLQDWQRDLLKWEGAGDDIPVYSDLSGTVFDPGIRLLALMERNSHADTYTADHTKIREEWYEVKVFPAETESPKQNRYQKRTIKRNLARELYQYSARSGLYLFLVFSVEFNLQQSKWSVRQLERLSLLNKLLKKRSFRTETYEAGEHVNELAKNDRLDSSTYNIGELEPWIKLSPQWEYPHSFFGTELEAAAFFGFAQLVQACIKNKNYIHASAPLILPLRDAAGVGYLDIVKILLHAGADLHVPFVNGSRGNGSPLHAAARGGHLEIFNVLLDAGAKINPTKLRFYKTLLEAAAPGGHAEIMKILVDAGVKIDAEPSRVGVREVLQAAVEQGHARTVNLLMDAGAGINADPSDHQGHTVLPAAVERGHAEIVKLLVEAGVDVNNCVGGCRTALQAAVERGNAEIVKLLIEAGVQANTCVGGRRTALQAAVERGHAEVVHTLLAAGANVNARGDSLWGPTALQAAAGAGDLDGVRILLAAKAKVNAPPTIGGKTALQAAVHNGHLEVVRVLLAAKANSNAPRHDIYGQTALQVAAMEGHLDIVLLLLTECKSERSSCGILW